MDGLQKCGKLILSVFTPGATNSVWLDGTNPTKVGEIKTVKTKVVCQGCYAKPWDVKIKKCSNEDNKEFFIYNLPPVPRCPMVYCAGKG